MFDHEAHKDDVTVSGWPPAAVDFIKAQSAQGVSSSQIARGLFEKFRLVKSRNAVIGKLLRCGAARPASRVAAKPRAVAEKVAKPEKPQSAEKQKPLVRAVSFGRLPGAPKKALPAPPAPQTPSLHLALHLRGCGCAFPTGEDSNGSVFCGQPVTQDHRSRPYCETHLRLMYPAQASRNIRPPYEGPVRGRSERDTSFLSRWG